MQSTHEPTMKNSLDYYNFCTMDTRLPIMEILNERFTRCFRVSFSNYIRMISTIKYSSRRLTFGEWVKENQQHTFMSVLRLKSLKAPMLIHFDREFSYGTINLLAGEESRGFEPEGSKEFTQIELSMLRPVADLVINDLNEAWFPVENIQAEYLRTEINAQFVGIIPPDERVIAITFEIEFSNRKGAIELLFPYSMLFPIRDKLYTNV
jgi:flagellar motor switch protein FliM